MQVEHTNEMEKAIESGDYYALADLLAEATGMDPALNPGSYPGNESDVMLADEAGTVYRWQHYECDDLWRGEVEED